MLDVTNQFCIIPPLLGGTIKFWHHSKKGHKTCTCLLIGDSCKTLNIFLIHDNLEIHNLNKFDFFVTYEFSVLVYY